MAFESSEAFSEWDSESEAAEAARPIRKPSSQPSFKPRPAPNAPQYVTQTQLETSLTRVDGKVKTFAESISTVSSRIAAISASLKKEADERKKTGEGLNKDINQKMQMLGLLPLLIPQKSAALAPGTLADANGANIPAVATPDANSALDSLLPLLMISGMGGTGGSGGFGFGSDGSGSDGSMMMLALVLALSNK